MQLDLAHPTAIGRAEHGRGAIPGLLERNRRDLIFPTELLCGLVALMVGRQTKFPAGRVFWPCPFAPVPRLLWRLDVFSANDQQLLEVKRRIRQQRLTLERLEPPHRIRLARAHGRFERVEARQIIASLRIFCAVRRDEIVDGQPERLDSVVAGLSRHFCRPQWMHRRNQQRDHQKWLEDAHPRSA